MQPVADCLGGLQYLIGGTLRGLHHGFQLDATVLCRGQRRRDDRGDLLVDACELGRKAALAVIDELHRGMDLHAQLSDASIDEAAQFVELGADGGAHDVFQSVGHGAYQTPPGLRPGKATGPRARCTRRPGWRP